MSVVYTDTLIENTIRVTTWVARSIDSTGSACNGMLDLYISEAIQQHHCGANRPPNILFMCHALGY